LYFGLKSSDLSKYSCTYFHFFVLLNSSNGESSFFSFLSVVSSTSSLSSDFTGGTIVVEVCHLLLCLSFQLSSHSSFGLSITVAAGFFSLSLSLFLLNVLENQGNPRTNHLAPPFTASVHGVPGVTFEISKKAWLILEAASWATAQSISRAAAS
jgi:hypothetical protein